MNVTEHTPRTIAVLGSTGSVGTQALDVARHLGLRVDLISGHHNIALLERQIREFRPTYCAVTDPASAAALSLCVQDTDTKILSGNDGLVWGIHASRAETVIHAILGFAGLSPTFAVLDAGKRLGLANKESMVIAGETVRKKAKASGAEILPVDSEHCAIFQCMLGGRSEQVRRILLTASGGPFFGRTRADLSHVTKQDTLAHPTWSMGAKITVDSATLMNKGFEVIEAVHLFGVRPEQIQVVVHRESIIHSAVEYTDHGILAQLSVPDMRMCVQYAVTYPDRMEGVTPPLDLFRVGNLSFAPPDGDAFPLLPLAYRSVGLGGCMPCILNGANEIAVAAFLREEIGFCDIFDTVTETHESLLDLRHASSLEALQDADAAARRRAEEIISRIQARKKE